MLLLFPVAAYMGLVLAFAATPCVRGRQRSLAEALLWGSLIMGAVLAFGSEVLSLFRQLSRLPITTLWAAVAAISGWFAWRRGGLRRLRHWLGELSQESGRVPGALGLALLSAEAALLGVVALISPPNNTDSLLYHMSRVVHWAQNGKLSHYATGFDAQLMHPIWAETAILHLRLLIGNDGLANMVQWLAYLGCLVGVSATAGLTGMQRSGRLAALAFAASAPIVILEATSTQNDLVAAFWFVCLTFFTLRIAAEGTDLASCIGLGLALGLGMLTKFTFYPLAVPFVLWAGVSVLRKGRPRNGFACLAVGAGLAVLLNLGHWLRNYGAYGSPLGPLTGWALAPPGLTHLPTLLMYAVEALAINFVTPSVTFNHWLSSGLDSMREFLHSRGPAFELVWAWNHEDRAGSPLHWLIALVTVVVAWRLRYRSADDSLRSQYAIVCLGSALLLFAYVGPDGGFGVRYQVPLLVAFAPILGGVVGRARCGPRVSIAVAWGLLLLGVPWILLNQTRPLLGWKPRTATDSILQEEATRLLFANWTWLQGPYVDAARAVRDSGCQRIGLMLDSHDLEYPWWWLLDAPQSGYHLETVYALPWLEGLIDRSFRPCVIVCTICEGRRNVHGLDRLATFGPVDVYRGDSFDWERRW